MKSLEEVIKYKLNFLPEGIEPFYAIQTYTPERGAYAIYKTKNAIFSNDSLSFLEDITPLFIYISSCDKYYREKGYGKFIDIAIALNMAGGYSFKLCSSHASGYNDDDLDEHKIAILKARANVKFSREGYCERYTKPFTVLLYGGFDFFLTVEERLLYGSLDFSLTDEEKLALQRLTEESRIEEKRLVLQRLVEERRIRERQETERRIRERQEAERRLEERRIKERQAEAEFLINGSRTFKLEQCVICLEKEPKVLFCNCGHFCICDECFVEKLNNCPVCKEKSTILRVIE